jgi:hypothetical protein
MAHGLSKEPQALAVIEDDTPIIDLAKIAETSY